MPLVRHAHWLSSRRFGHLERGLAGLAILLAALGFAAGAEADPPSPSPPCQLERGSLSFVACSLAQQLGLPASAAPVVVVDLKSDRELPSAEALRERVRSGVATALGALGPNTGGAAGAHAERSKLLVELSIEKTGGVLRVSAELRRRTGLWQRVRHAKPSAERHAFVETPLDAELRALIPPPPLVVSEVLKLKAPERGLVALACGPLGSDGGQELALISRGSVRVGRIVGRIFAERKRAAWSALSAVAPAPLREPIASAEVTPQGALRVGLSDRRDGLELSRDLLVTARFEGLMPVPGGGCAERSALGLLARFQSCTQPGAGRTPAATLDAVAGVPGVQLGRDGASARLNGARPELTLAPHGVGAQLALGDADSDGNPELAFSSDTLDATKDRLTLVTLDGKKMTPRFELPAPSISAIAICSRREGPGMAPLIVATGDELWLIR
jgi:hypothetical protein